MASVRIYVKLKYEGQAAAFYDISSRVNYTDLAWESNSEGTSANASVPVWTILPKSSATISSYAGATFADKLNNAIADESFLIEIPNRSEIRILDTSTNPDTVLFAGIITRVSTSRQGGSITQDIECADNTAILEEHVIADYYAPRDSRDVDVIYGGTTSYTSAASLPSVVGQIDGLSLSSESTGGSLTDGEYEVRAQARSSTLVGRDGFTPQYGPVTKAVSLTLSAGTSTQQLKIKWKNRGASDSVRIYVIKKSGSGSGATEYLAKNSKILTSSLKITAATRTANQIEITTESAHGLSVGDPIIVSIPQTPGFSVDQSDFAIVTNVGAANKLKYYKAGDNGSASVTNSYLSSGGSAAVTALSTVESPTVITSSSARGWADGEIYTVAGTNWRLGIGPDNVRNWLYPISVFGGLFDQSWVSELGLNTSTYVEAVDTKYRFSPYFQESDTPNAEQYGGRTVRNILDYISEKTGAEYWIDKGSIDGSGNYSSNLHYGAKTPKELVVNGLYDGNLNGWTTAAGFSLQSSTSGPYGAGYSVLSSTDSTSIETDPASRAATSPGKKYFFSVRGKVSEHQNRLGAYIVWYNSSGTEIHSDHIGNIPGDPIQTWHRIWKIAQAPASAAYFGMRGQCTNQQHGSASFTDWSAIEITGTVGYGDFEDIAGYPVPIYEMEIPTSPVESGNTVNRLHLYAVFRTKDSSGNKVALTDNTGNPVQYVDYDFVPGIWATSGKIVEAAITDDRVETLADAELSAAGYWKENGLPIESYTFDMRPWDANGNEYTVPNVGDIIPFIWSTMGVAKPLIVKSVSAKMIGTDVAYTITIGGDVRLQRSAFIRLSEKIKELDDVNPVPPIPDAPSDVTVSSNDKSISVSWVFDQEKEINKKLASFEIQRQDAIFRAITDISRSGTTVTVTTAIAHGMVNGDTIRIDLNTTQTNLSGLEGQWTVSSTTTTSFTYACVSSGTIATAQVDGYVYYNFTEFRTVQNTKATYVNDSGLLNALQYRYKIRSLSTDLTASEFTEPTEPIAPNETTATVANGSVTAEKLVSSLRPLVIISGDNLPSLPDAQYPAGTMVYHLGGTPPGLRRVSDDGASWQNAIGESDIVAESITTGLISAAGLDAGVVKSGKLVIDGRWGASAGVANVVYKYKTGTTATLWTSTAHGYSAADNIYVSSVATDFNGNKTISSVAVPSSRKARTGNRGTIALDQKHAISPGDQITVSSVDAALNGVQYVDHTDEDVSHKTKWGNKVALRTQYRHVFTAGENVTVTGADANFNGTFAISSVTPAAAKKAQGVPAASGTDTSPTTGASATASITTTDPNAFAVGDSVVVANSGTTALNGTKTVTSRGFGVTHFARSGTTATIRTSEYHGVDVGDQMYIEGLGSPYDGYATATATNVPVIRTQSFATSYLPTFVASSSANFGSATTGTLNMPAGAQQGDLVIVNVGSDGASPGTAIGTSSTGWTKLLTGIAATGDVGQAIFTKIMGATPDTSIAITGLATASAACAMLIRTTSGVLTATPATASPATATTGMPNPPAITTSRNNALIVIAGALDDDNITDTVAPTGYSNLVNQAASVTGCTVMMATKSLTAVATEDPGAFASATGTDGWSAMTIAVSALDATDIPLQTITSSSPTAFNTGDYVEIAGTTATYNGGRKVYANSVDVTFKAQSTTTATITTKYPHGFITGDKVTISGVGAPFDVTDATVTVAATTGNPQTFTYTVATSATVATTASGGSASSSKTFYVYAPSASIDGIATRTGTATSYSTISYTTSSGENRITSVSPNGLVRTGRSFSFTATSASIVPTSISGTADNYRSINYVHGTTDATPTLLTALSPYATAETGQTITFTTATSGDIAPQAAASGTVANGKSIRFTTTAGSVAFSAVTPVGSVEKKTDTIAISSPNFSVAYDGVVTATGANISGTVNASNGTIGGWTIGSSTLTGGSITLNSAGDIVVGTNGLYLSSTNASYVLWAGNASPTNASTNFRVSDTGVLTAKSATLTSATMSELNITVGTKAAITIAHSGTYGDIVAPDADTISIGHVTNPVELYVNSSGITHSANQLVVDSGGLNVTGIGTFSSYVVATSLRPGADTNIIDHNGTFFTFNDGVKTSAKFYAVPGAVVSGSAGAAVFNLYSGSGTTGVYQIDRLSSSRRYKENIVEADQNVIDAAKRIRAVHFDSNIESEIGKSALGFIAEEVDEAGLDHAVYYDQGQPEAINDRPMLAALWAWVRELESRVAELEG